MDAARIVAGTRRVVRDWVRYGRVEREALVAARRRGSSGQSLGPRYQRTDTRSPGQARQGFGAEERGHYQQPVALLRERPGSVAEAEGVQPQTREALRRREPDALHLVGERGNPLAALLEHWPDRGVGQSA